MDTFPVHLVSDPATYGTKSLERRKLEELKKCLRNIRFVHVTDPAVLRSAGWKAITSTASRAPIGTPKTEAEYWKWAEGATSNKHTAIIAGLLDGELAGYMTAYAVEDTGYLDELVVPTQYLSTGISTGLYFQTMQVFQRLGGIKQVSAHYHIPEDEGLAAYKTHRFSGRIHPGQVLHCQPHEAGAEGSTPRHLLPFYGPGAAVRQIRVEVRDT